MISKTHSHGFELPLNYTTYANYDYFYVIERPFVQLGGNILKSIKVIGSKTYKDPRVKIAILEETSKYRDYKIVWMGELNKDEKYGDNIYYIDGLNIKCPKETYIGILIEKKPKYEYRNVLYTDAEGQQWYVRRPEDAWYSDYKADFNTFTEGYVATSKVFTNRLTFHFPMQFEYDVPDKPKILFQDESGEYKVFKQQRYENMAKAVDGSTHISCGGTHPNHQNTLWNVFDGNEDSFWVSSTGNTFPKWIKYDFGAPTTIDRFEMMPAKINNTNYWGIANWTLLGSNDDATYIEIYKSDSTSATKNLDHFNYQNGSHMRYVNFINNKPTFRYFKVEFRNSHYGTTPYDYVVAVKHMGFMRLKEKGWESIGLNVGENEFLQYGMNVDEIEHLTNEDLSKLQGVYTVQVFVPDKSVNKVSMIKDTEETIWLENETTDVFDVVRYTENIFFNEAKYIVDNDKRTLYDYFTDDIDVSIYSEDAQVNDKFIEVSQTYSPLDDLSGDIEVYEYSDTDKSNSIKGDVGKLQEDFVHSVDGAFVDSVDINLNDVTKGKTKKIINY